MFFNSKIISKHKRLSLKLDDSVCHVGCWPSYKSAPAKRTAAARVAEFTTIYKHMSDWGESFEIRRRHSRRGNKPANGRKLYAKKGPINSWPLS